MKITALLVASLTAATLFADPETELAAKLPEIFKASEVHYAKLAEYAESHQGETPRFPRNIVNGEVGLVDVYDWTSGFFPGSLWYLYEATGNGTWKASATKWTDRLEPLKNGVDNHDIGFMLYCPAGNALRITGDKKYEPWLHAAAKCLRERFNEKVGTIKSWNSWGENFGFFGMHHVTIVDNMMNLELLLWDSRYTYTVDGAWWSGQVAIRHADTTNKHHFRPDGSVYHILDYNPDNGQVLGIRAGQGADVEGTWARGQAWAVYGYTMMYRETGFIRYLDRAVKAADYVMSTPTPADGIPYWDYHAANIPDEPRDSSAAAILSSALLELSQYVDHAKATAYRAWAVKALNSLASPAYFAKPGQNGDFLLMHGTGCKPTNTEIDTPLNYGDYYFLEALLRFRKLRAREALYAPLAGLLPPKATLPDDEFDWRNCYRDRDIGTEPAQIAAAADRVLVEPIPDTSDKLYGEYWKNGNRTDYETVFCRKIQNLGTLVKAETLTGRGKYLPRIDDYLRNICAMKSWVLPAHDWSDGGKGTFSGTTITADLFGTEVGAFLASVLRKLDGRLDPRTVALVKANAERRVFGPVRREVPPRLYPKTAIGLVMPLYSHLWWINVGNNWNSVCWDNVVAAACGLLDDPMERAYFIDAADRACAIYLEGGFDADGYCSEGMGYWNYGFGHHLLTGRMLNRITRGKFDFFRRPKDRLAAAYARSYTLAEGASASKDGNAAKSSRQMDSDNVSPAFADGNGGADPLWLQLVDEFWPDLPKAIPPVSVFPSGQVWLLRDPQGLSVAFKGGHNNELHNHNDVGSYYLIDRGKFISGDPGKELYTRRTFSSKRYESKLLNSYGHPVPVVGGKLQSFGRQFAAKVLEDNSTAAGDGEAIEVTLDLTAAYEVPSLKSLTRTFVYDRAAKTFAVRDRVEFKQPTEFEDCYITGGEPVKVTVKALKGGELVAEPEEVINNPPFLSPHRFGFKFAQPVTEAEVEFTFSR